MTKTKINPIDFDYSKVRGSTEMHNKFKKEFMIYCSRKFPDVMVIPYDVGFYRAYSQPDIIVRCGQDGVPDTIVLGCGWYLLLDMKTGKNKFQENQKAIKARIAEINKGRERVFKIKSSLEGICLIGNCYD